MTTNGMTNRADDLAKLTEASGDPEAFQAVYSALLSAYESSCRVGHMTQFADEAAAIAVLALRDIDRLPAPNLSAAHREPRERTSGSDDLTGRLAAALRDAAGLGECRQVPHETRIVRWWKLLAEHDEARP